MPNYTESIERSEPIRALYAESIEHVVARLRAHAAQSRARITPQSMADHAAVLRREYEDMLGLNVLRTVLGTDLPQVTCSLVGEDALCRIERMRICLAEDIYFTGLLLTPYDAPAKAPLTVMCHGGGGSPELCCDMLGKNNYGGVPRRLLEHGCTVFAPQLLLWSVKPALCGGAIPQYATPYNRSLSDIQLKQCGASIAGFEIYAIRRSLDWLLAQPSLQQKPCGMLGLSYGGFYTLYTMACEERIQAGWSAAFCNDRVRYGWQDFVWKDSASRFLDGEVAGLCAPRPLIIDVGETDSVFASDTAAAVLSRAREFYSAQGVENRICTNLWSGEHRFCPDSLPKFLAALGCIKK